MNTPYVQLVNALAASSSSLVGQERLGALGLQASAWPANAVAPAVVLPAMPAAPALALVPPSAAASVDLVRPDLAPATALTPARPMVPVQSVAIQAVLNGAESDLREVRNDTRRRVDRSFYVSLGLGVLGGIALLTGIGLAFAQAVPIGITSGIGGAASSIFSGIFLHLYRTESSELRGLVADLRRIQDARVGLWLADQIQDQEQRDTAVRDLIVQITRSASPRVARTSAA